MIAQHFYSFQVVGGRQEYIMDCLLCGHGIDSVAINIHDERIVSFAASDIEGHGYISSSSEQMLQFEQRYQDVLSLVSVPWTHDSRQDQDVGEWEE